MELKSSQFLNQDMKYFVSAGRILLTMLWDISRNGFAMKFVESIYLARSDH